MSSLRKWIRKKLGSKPHEGGGPIHPELPLLPYLSTPRPRPLTAPRIEPRPKSYGFFESLPLEVRRQILIEAFGGRTLHMDLSYRHPLARRPNGSGSEESSTRQHCGLDSELVTGTSQPQQWQWFSCVCHRRPGYSEHVIEQKYATGELVSETIEPCDDECLEGPEAMCRWGGNRISCFVGVMGWLLSCRQAYTDGIDILYSTNTFHISSLDLQLNLRRLVPAHHLAQITSLELLWKLNAIQGRINPPTKDHAKPLWESDQALDSSPLHLLCTSIPQIFPHLRSLYISFQCWLTPSVPRSHEDDVISEVEIIFLAPIENMRRAWSGNLELNVAVQSGAWGVLLKKYQTLLGADLRTKGGGWPARGRFWKPLGPSVRETGGGGEGDAGVEDGGSGYWICGGWEDVKAIGQGYWVISNWGDKWHGGVNYDTF